MNKAFSSLQQVVNWLGEVRHMDCVRPATKWLKKEENAQVSSKKEENAQVSCSTKPHDGWKTTLMSHYGVTNWC